jgi:hypothetical protein
MVSAIGAGVFGCVFLAKDAEGRKVAIKRIRLSHPSHYDPQYKREIEVLQLCSHRNIVKLIEVVQSKKFEKYLVLEHCHTDFKVVTGKNTGIAQLKNVMLQLLDGIVLFCLFCFRYCFVLFCFVVVVVFFFCCCCCCCCRRRRHRRRRRRCCCFVVVVVVVVVYESLLFYLDLDCFWFGFGFGFRIGFRFGFGFGFGFGFSF